MLAAQPSLEDARCLQATLDVHEARWRLLHDLSPEAVLIRLAVATQTMDADPSDAGSYAVLAEIHWQQAVWHRLQSRSLPRASSTQREIAYQHIGRALAWTDKALGIDPTNARIHAVRGALFLEMARIEPSLGSAHRAQGRASLEQALHTNRLLEREFGPILRAAESDGVPQATPVTTRPITSR